MYNFPRYNGPRGPFSSLPFPLPFDTLSDVVLLGASSANGESRAVLVGDLIGDVGRDLTGEDARSS